MKTVYVINAILPTETRRVEMGVDRIETTDKQVLFYLDNKLLAAYPIDKVYYYVQYSQ